MKKVLFFIVLILAVTGAHYAFAADYLVKFEEGYTPSESEKMEVVNERLNIYRTASKKQVKDLSQQPCVEYVEEDVTFSLIENFTPISLMSLPTDELYLVQWQLQMIKAQAAWAIETYGNDIRVAVIDSGCIECDELSENIVAGHNYVTGTDDYTDINGHETNVSGIIAAANNGEGFVGIAPKAKLVQLKCFENDSASSEDIAKAIVDAVDVYNCKVINMSFGFDGFSKVVESALEYAASKGAIPIAAVGNNGTSSSSYPASSKYAIGVGSVNIRKEHSSFSQYNSSVMVTAPGESVLGISPDAQSYLYYSGTSQAAPQLSAAAAIALSMDDSLTFNDFTALIAASCEDLGDEGYDYYFGYGLLNIEKMVNKLLEKVPFYVSPVNDFKGKKGVFLKNNTPGNYTAKCIWTSFDENGNVTDIKVFSPLMMSGAEMLLPYTPAQGCSAKFMMWNTFSAMAPMFNSRVYK